MTATQVLNIKTNALLDQGKYDELEIILKQEKDNFFSSNKSDFTLLVEITGGLISLGIESYKEACINEGLKILVEQREDLLTAATEGSLDYFMGNAKHGLYKIYLKNNTPYKYPTPEIAKTYLFEPRSALFRAYKTLNLKKLDAFTLAVLTNLGSELSATGRIVEALQLYDSVLKATPNHPQSLFCKAEAMVQMARSIKFHKTLSFYGTIYSLYSKGEQYTNVPADIKEGIRKGKEATLRILEANNFDINKIEVEFLESDSEFKLHNPTTKYYLTNFLSLSEHGLYCKCIAAKTDDLTLGIIGYKTSDKKLMRLESLLNRLKSEFSFARKIYYDYHRKSQSDNMLYAEMLDGVEHGLDIESLRNSFRLCFGIFDKIAKGIIHLYDLPVKNNEYIYFEKFWESHQPRWQAINAINNLHLTALYSIGMDLNMRGGELHFYKEWRNELEHAFFSIRSENKDLYGYFGHQMFDVHTDEKDFATKTLHVLQLARAAIFSFAFCVRKELVSQN